MADREEILRRMTLGDVTCAGSRVGQDRSDLCTGVLDPVGEALVKVGALMASDGSGLTWQQTVGAALDAGLTSDELVDALVVLAPIIGWTKAVKVAPKLALATGFDVAAALEAR